MTAKFKYELLKYFIAMIWLVNGLVCKVLNLVPRHEKIINEILGENLSIHLTLFIGLAEILMAIWIISGIKSNWNAITQIVIISLMNIIEFFLAPNLLLWGRYNILFAFGLVFLVYYNEFILKKKIIYPLSSC